MKHTDENIREIFSKKLGEHESDVSPHLWEAIQNVLPKSAASSVGAGAKLLGMKFIVAAAITVGMLVMAVLYINSEKDQPEIGVKQNTQVSAEQSPIETVNQNPKFIGKPEEFRVGSEEVAAVTFNNETPDSKTAQLASNKEVRNETNHNVLSESALENTQEMTSESKVTKQTDNDEIEEVVIESLQPVAKPMSAVFKILPVDMNLMEYSFVSNNERDVVYLWNFGDAVTSSEQAPKHIYEAEGEYEVTLLIADNNSQSLSSTHTLSVYKPGKVLIPNVFTPNGDGSNDTFDPGIKSEGVTFTQILVYDRQGICVFESDGGTAWDGTDKSGSPCSGGTYQYYIKGIDRNHEILENKGALVLIR